MKTFFVAGKVFATPWPEPIGATSRGNPPILPNNANIDVSDAASHMRVTDIFQKEIFLEIRRFIVVKAFTHHSLCVPISTHHHMGAVGRHDARFHSIIYNTDHAAPAPLQGEQVDKYVIAVILEGDSEDLHPASKINFSQTYTVQHNVKVKKIGRISKENIEWVKTYWKECMVD